jgi:hypothetical protein
VGNGLGDSTQINVFSQEGTIFSLEMRMWEGHLVGITRRLFHFPSKKSWLLSSSSSLHLREHIVLCSEWGKLTEFE